MLEVVLHPGRDRSVRRRHPWLYASAVARADEPEAGAAAGPCRVLSAEGETLGYGDLAPGSKLRVRLLCFGKEPPADDWLEARLRAAVARRARDPGLADTDAVRLVNAEGDGLPGLVVDRYADVVVQRASSAGMAARRERVAELLARITGAPAGVARDDQAGLRREGVAGSQDALWGETPDALWIRERARRYRVDPRAGQKTGFYLDQREARDRVQALAAGRRVLDLFCYTGGFGVAAALGGAREVTLVDSSGPALELARENLAANAPAVPARVEQGDVSAFLRAGGDRYDLLVIDPPPLARAKADVQRATRAYKDVILRALRRAAPDAILLAFACSHHVGADLFRKIAFGASLDAERPLRVLAQLSAPADHAVSLDHPEGQYLTGLLLEA